MDGEGAYNCSVSRCGRHGPRIHFPFRLHHQPEYCGYPGFELSCDLKNRTILILPNSLTLIVEEIDYMSQQIRLSDPERCLILKLLHLNLSESPFSFTVAEPYLTLENISIFKCSGMPAYYRNYYSDCASDKTLFAVSYSLYSLPHTTCIKIHEIPSYGMTTYSVIRLSWLNTNCSYCEGLEKDCGFKNYTKQLTTQCFDRPFTTKGIDKPIFNAMIMYFSIP
uniref:RING-type E3 ubiquitin transferase n=1 Tax=Solanum tuberosum TaxID=4113 RepID=M1APE5_SOLTU